jgi:hypothetical protein
MDHIKNLLYEFIEKMSVDKADDGDIIMENWTTIAGTLSKGTKPFKYDKKKVYIYADNSVIMSEITYKKRALIAKVNRYFGREAVKEIICRIKQ